MSVGNGTDPPLVERVAIVEQRQDRAERRLDACELVDGEMVVAITRLDLKMTDRLAAIHQDVRSWTSRESVSEARELAKLRADNERLRRQRARRDISVIDEWRAQSENGEEISALHYVAQELDEVKKFTGKWAPWLGGYRYLVMLVVSAGVGALLNEAVKAMWHAAGH